MDSTFDKLKTILVRDYKGDPQALTPQTPLEDLGIDSLGTVELLWTVEEEFGIELPREPVTMTDIAAVVSFIDGVVAAQKTGSAATSGAPTSEATAEAARDAAAPSASTP